MRRSLRTCGLLLLGLSLVWGCAFDDTLREYLDAHFWLPFSKRAWHFEKRNVRRISAPFAGMAKAQDNKPLSTLRAAYQRISGAPYLTDDNRSLQADLSAARADKSLTQREREEVDLLDAKIDMRTGEPRDTDLLESAQKKLEKFLKTARTPALLSEARGWLAHIHYIFGEQTEAGKIYLDELNRNGSNLSRETLLNSLSMTYGYDGGPELRAHLDEYFDTPEHAAFAIQLVTNPHWDRDAIPQNRRVDTAPQSYQRIKRLLQTHRSLFQTEAGANALALLSMRTALRMGDPPSALEIAEMIPADAAIRNDPDFLWMLASARFLSRDYAGTEQPLLSLFETPRLPHGQQAAAAYGLCGVYEKLNRPVEQIRFALWLSQPPPANEFYSGVPDISDQTIYWAASGWDLGLLLDAQAPDDALEALLEQYPNAPNIRLVKYALAVRRARENRYEESAQLYESIQANRRSARMRQMAALYRAATDNEAKYKLAEFISANPNRLYFNDTLWSGFQRYALTASSDSRLNRQEHQTLSDDERKLKDDQEERWRAYLILRDIVRDAGPTPLRRNATLLALRCLRGINLGRFGREDDIRKADVELGKALRQ